MSRKKEATGYYLLGSTVATIVAAATSAFVWQELRTNQESMEGGWTRTVYDSTSYPAVFGWGCAIALTVWTLGFVIYWLIDDSK